MTDLYSRSQEAFATPHPSNHTETVTGPYGNAFSDLSANRNMYAYERFQKVNSSRCGNGNGEKTYKAFCYVFADANTISLHTATFAALMLK
jgi:hypothetical protein